MEEKTKNIILPIIAILLGLIVGGCTQVKAEVIPINFIGASVGLYEGTGGNTTFCWLRYQDVGNPCEWKNGMYRYWTISITPVILKGGGYYNANIEMEVIYKTKQKSTRFEDIKFGYNGIFVDGRITEAILDETPKDPDGYYHRHSKLLLQGYYEMRNYDSSVTFLNFNFKTSETIEFITAFIRDYPALQFLTGNEAQIEANRQDAQAQINAQKEEFDKLINSGEFNKPNKDTALEDLEDDESLLQDILGIPNYNDLNIDIDNNTNSAIWDLIIRIWNQNTAILTMVITILSISILKLILNR